MGKIVLKKVVHSSGNYSCDELDITVDEWKSVLQDISIHENCKLWLARFYREPGHKATCKHMGEKFNCHPQSPNSIITNFGRAVRRILNRFEVRGTDDELTYWVIPMKTGRYVDGYFEWTMRDELVQAMEELKMTNSEQFEGKNSFTWIPFYMEMADKLLEYKDNRDELIKIVYSLDEDVIEYFKDDKKERFKDIHPFVFFGIFNRKITIQKKEKICLHFKKYLAIDADLPSDFDGIPVVNNQKSWWGMPWSGDDAVKDIESNWKIFEIAQKEDVEVAQFNEEFDFILSRGGAKKYLTMALFWIRPYDFMPLDTPSRTYLEKIGIKTFDEKQLNAENYLKLNAEIKEAIQQRKAQTKS